MVITMMLIFQCLPCVQVVLALNDFCCVGMFNLQQLASQLVDDAHLWGVGIHLMFETFETVLHDSQLLNVVCDHHSGEQFLLEETIANDVYTLKSKTRWDWRVNYFHCHLITHFTLKNTPVVPWTNSISRRKESYSQIKTDIFHIYLSKSTSSCLETWYIGTFIQQIKIDLYLPSHLSRWRRCQLHWRVCRVRGHPTISVCVV